MPAAAVERPRRPASAARRLRYRNECPAGVTERKRGGGAVRTGGAEQASSDDGAGEVNPGYRATDIGAGALEYFSLR